MSFRTALVVLALASAPFPDAPSDAQLRAPTLSIATDSLRLAHPPAGVGFSRDSASWRERNAVDVGLLVGGAVGFGFALRNAYGRDFQCPAEWMVPCWTEFPLLAAYGAGIGAFFGWIASLPMKPRERE
jgi:hypothetical protein